LTSQLPHTTWQVLASHPKINVKNPLNDFKTVSSISMLHEEAAYAP
jgi:hypothetical protein